MGERVYTPSAVPIVLKRVLLGLGALLLAAVAFVAYKVWPRVEAIPEELDAIDVAEANPMDVVIPAQSNLPELALKDLSGHTSFFIIDSRESMEAGEAKQLKRQLDFWDFPDTVKGFGIADVEGFGLLSGKIQEVMDFIRPEARWPLYADFDGVMTRTFKMPKGHFGIVVMGPDGEVTMRHSGEADEGVVAKIKAALGATDPSPGEPAPTFTVGELDNEACKPKGCMLVFLGEKVALSDVPGVEEGGFEGSMMEAGEQMKKPAVRLVHRLIAYWHMKGSELPGALVGEVENVAVEGWTHAREAPDLRQTFAIPADESAMVVIDPEGRVAFKGTGSIPFYKFSTLRNFVKLPEGDKRMSRGE